MTIRECILCGLVYLAPARCAHEIIHYQNCRLLEYINQNYLYKTANETNGAKKYLEDNLHQLRRQFMTIRECILFGLEECAGALATHNKMMYSKTANETNGAKKYLEDNLHQ